MLPSETFASLRALSHDFPIGVIGSATQESLTLPAASDRLFK
jgi:hypothetical protein